MSSNTTRRMKIGDFLLRRLRDAGVRHLFGVPGDYNLELLQQLQDTGALRWIGTCSELNASYAADGYARLNGLGALLVTNGVGALSAINGVGGSYSEHVPVICIAGSIPLRSVERGLGMHHTMADGSYDHFLDAYAHVTAAHARLTPRNAVTEIDRLILTAWREKRPVYMELPSDIAYLDIEVPAEPLTLADAPSDPERLRSCIAAIVARLSAAKSPAILVDADADRFGVASELMGLAEKMQVPIAVINTAKSVIDETFPYYLGIYIGKPSEAHVREAIETSDCLLAIGYRPLEVTTGDFSASLPANTIHARGHSVDVGDDNYQAVTLKEVLNGVIDAIPRVTSRAPRPVAPAVARKHPDPSAKLTQAAYWQAMQGYLREGNVLFDTITALTEAKVISLGKDTLLEVAKSDVCLSNLLFTAAARAAAVATEQSNALRGRKVTEQLALFLLEMDSRLSKGGEIYLPMHRQHIADYFGLSMETVSRTFSAFHKARIIDFLDNPKVQRRVVIRDKRRLERFASDAADFGWGKS